MSREAFSDFMKTLSDDTALQDEVRQASEGSGDDAAISTERLVEIARARGFEFTADDAHGSDELGDDELEAVAGGASFSAPTRRSIKGYYKLGDIEGMAMKERFGRAGTPFYKV